MYSAIEGGVFQFVHKLRLCKANKNCARCDAVAKQIQQEPMQTLLTPPKPKKKSEIEVAQLFIFELPLQKPLCNNTTTFSKWIAKKKPHLSKRMLVCGNFVPHISLGLRGKGLPFSSKYSSKQLPGRV